MIRFLSLFVVTSVSVIAQTVVFNHRVEDRAFLNYYYIWNQFDSSAVLYDFGEVTFFQGVTRQNIPLSGLVKDRERVQGTGAQGISTDLQGLTRTEDFSIPGAGKIQWFGQLQSFRSPCNGLEAQGESPNRPMPNWGVVDRTEFVVQLVDSYSGIVLATLDSVGVNPTGAVPPVVDTRYGVEPERARRSATIPAAFTGKTAYVRVSPRRFGPTPYGLILSRYDLWINQSALYDSTGTTPVSLAQVAALRDRWFAELLTYCDSAKAQTGWLPDLEGISFADDSHLATFHRRYFNPRLNATGDTLWQERNTLSAAPPKRGSSFTQIKSVDGSSMAPLAGFRNIAPNPIASETVEIGLIVGIDMNARLVLISVDGRRAGTIWEGSLMLGRPQVTAKIPPDIPNGSYTLLLEQENGERVNQSTLVIAR
jgi:hypothetical protein